MSISGKAGAAESQCGGVFLFNKYSDYDNPKVKTYFDGRDRMTLLWC